MSHTSEAPSSLPLQISPSELSSGGADAAAEAVSLRESEARFRSTFDDAATGMTINSLDGVLLEVNDAFCRFLGVERGDLLGANVLTLCSASKGSEIRALRQRCIDGEMSSYRFEKEYRHRDGRPIWGELTSSLVRDSTTGEPLYFIAQISDITARKRLETQMIQGEKLASLGKLVAGLAHEINNPLAVISGQAQLMERHPDAQIREDARSIREMAERASRIVLALRSYAQPAETSAETRREPGSLNHVVQDALDLLGETLRDAGVTVEREMSDALLPVPMNAGEIAQVLVNLLTNAVAMVKELPRERRTLHLRTWSITRDGDAAFPEAAALSLTDKGPGISATNTGRIFDPFFTTDPEEGKGLGLYISHSIIAAHGGTLSVESKERSGSTFTLCLPYR